MAYTTIDYLPDLTIAKSLKTPGTFGPASLFIDSVAAITSISRNVSTIP
jgi:hypothetical protein